jgi:hypothetical protein
VTEAKVVKQLRYVTIKDRRYIALADVASLLLEFAGAEETDVRNRIHELVNNLNKRSP